MTRFEPSNELHQAMLGAFRKVFGDRVAEHPIEMTRAVEQSGRFLSSVYEIDYREMTRETWRGRGRVSITAYEEFRGPRPGCLDAAGGCTHEPQAPHVRHRHAGRGADGAEPDRNLPRGEGQETQGARRGPMAAAISETASALRDRAAAGGGRSAPRTTPWRRNMSG